MSAVYIWYKDDLVVFDKRLGASDFREDDMLQYCGYPSLDAFEQETKRRYGFWHAKEGWKYQPYSDFSAAFKTHLLLLGVS